MIRLNRYVATASGLSRRAADEAIASGRIRVNNKVATHTTVLLSEDRVTFDGRQLVLPQTFRYYMLNKPVGYICSRAKQGNHPTIYNLIPKELHDLKSVGRLDRESSGLLLLSNDGTFIHRHLHPSFAKLKRYTIELDRPLESSHRDKLQHGVMLKDGLSHLEIEQVKGKRVWVNLEEGRNRQIRRTFAALGYTVVALHRYAFGSYSLGRLTSGSIRELTPLEATS